MRLCLSEFLVGVWRPAMLVAAMFCGTVVLRQLACDGLLSIAVGAALSTRLPTDTAALPILSLPPPRCCKLSYRLTGRRCGGFSTILTVGLLDRSRLMRGNVLLLPAMTGNWSLCAIFVPVWSIRINKMALTLQTQRLTWIVFKDAAHAAQKTHSVSVITNQFQGYIP